MEMQELLLKAMAKQGVVAEVKGNPSSNKMKVLVTKSGDIKIHYEYEIEEIKSDVGWIFVVRYR